MRPLVDINVKLDIFAPERRGIVEEVKMKDSSEDGCLLKSKNRQAKCIGYLDEGVALTAKATTSQRLGAFPHGTLSVATLSFVSTSSAHTASVFLLIPLQQLEVED